MNTVNIKGKPYVTVNERLKHIAEELISKSKNTPFVGIDLPGEVRHVFFQGKPTMISTEMVAR